jgi:SPOR domain
MNKAASVFKAFLQLTGCCFFIVLFFPSAAVAQTRGKVEIVKDARIDTFAVRRLELAKAISADGGMINGFRVQIFTGADRKEAYNTQAKFQEQYPDVRTCVIYNDPNFKVRVGDFRTRLDAEKMQDELKKWSTGLFIIQEKINQPKPETDE